MSYLISGAAYLSRAIIIAALVTIVIYILNRQKASPCKIAIHYTFNTYVILLGFITGLLQQPWDFSTQFSYNFFPFYDNDITQMTLNCILFIPMGIMLPMISNKVDTLLYSGTIMLGVSIVIEAIQMLFLGRFADVNDVIANSLGGIIGFGLHVFFQRKVLSKRKKQIDTGTLSIYFGLIGLFFGAGREGISFGDVILYNWGINTLLSSTYTACVMLSFGFVGLVVGCKSRESFLAREGIFISALVIVFSLLKIIF